MVKNKLFTHEISCFCIECSSLSNGFVRERWSDRIGFWKEEIIMFWDSKLVCQSNKHNWYFNVHFNEDTKY